MKKTDKFVIGMTCIAIFIAIFMICFFNHERKNIEVKAVDSIAIGNKESIGYEIESIEAGSHGDYLIKGWFIEKGVTYPFHNYGLDWHGESVYRNVKLCIIKDSSIYVFPTKLEDREDISESMGDDIEYEKAGFQAWIDKNYQDLMKESRFGVLVTDPYGGEKLYEFE